MEIEIGAELVNLTVIEGHLPMALAICQNKKTAVIVGGCVCLEERLTIPSSGALHIQANVACMCIVNAGARQSNQRTTFIRDLLMQCATRYVSRLVVQHRSGLDDVSQFDGITLLESSEVKDEELLPYTRS